ncbi:Signal peptide containing protein [Cryptosporidium felis]|nr:Signal peptide containing protein [Cryptosporidium felis]
MGTYCRYGLGFLAFLIGLVSGAPLPYSSEEVTVVPYPPFIPIAGGYIPDSGVNKTAEYIQKSGNSYFGNEMSKIVDFPVFRLASFESSSANKQVWAFLLGSEKRVFAYRTESIPVSDPLHLGSFWNTIGTDSTIWPIQLKFMYPSCNNMAKDREEEGVDCGGPCRPCNTFFSCRVGLDGHREHKALKYSTCVGELKHGEFCSLTCPVGFRMKDSTRMNSEIYSQCYDGRLQQFLPSVRVPFGGEGYHSRQFGIENRGMAESEIGNLDQSLSELCESPLDHMCRYISLRLMRPSGGGEAKEVTGNEGAVPCEGVFTSIPRFNERKSYWTSVNSEGKRVTLFWKENSWVCLEMLSNTVLGYIQDTNPALLLSEDHKSNLIWIPWSNEGPITEKRAFVELKCAEKTPIEKPGTCNTFTMQGWNYGTNFNGIWVFAGDNTDIFTGDVRGVYIKPYSRLVLLYNMYKLQWEIYERLGNVPFEKLLNTTLKEGGKIRDRVLNAETNYLDKGSKGWVLRAMNSHPSPTPPSGKWLIAPRVDHTDDALQGIRAYHIDVYCETKVTTLSGGEIKLDPLKLLTAKNEQPVFCSSGRPMTSFTLSSDLSDLFFKPKNGHLEKHEKAFGGGSCEYMKIGGPTAEAMECSGVFRKEKLPHGEFVWKKLGSNSRIVLFYWTGVKWICTRNDNSNRILGNKKVHRNLQRQWKESLAEGTRLSLPPVAPLPDANKGCHGPIQGFSSILCPCEM